MQRSVIVVASLGAPSHICFAYTGMADWSLARVKVIAPAWLAVAALATRAFKAFIFQGALAALLAGGVVL